MMIMNVMIMTMNIIIIINAFITFQAAWQWLLADMQVLAVLMHPTRFQQAADDDDNF